MGATSGSYAAVGEGAAASEPESTTKLNAADDAKPEKAPDGSVYWYNPRTQATAWSKETLIKRNKEFYRSVKQIPARTSKGPNGESKYWAWQMEDGQTQTAWSLQELYENLVNMGRLNSN